MKVADKDEAIQCVDALRAIYQSNEDIDRLRKIIDTVKSATTTAKPVTEDAKKIIKSLTATIHNERLAFLEQQRLATQLKIKQNDENIGKTKAQIDLLDREASKAEQQKHQKKAELGEIPEQASYMGLYNNIFRIHWDFSSKTLVKGTHVTSNRNDVKPFEFDREQVSQFKICNAIWDLLE